jgi:hypothetical protein
VNQAAAVRANDAREHKVVLLVEPSALHRAAFARALVTAGFYVRSLDALGTASTPRFAIVNLEDMKEDDADTLLAALLGPYHDVPLILLSSDPIDAEEGARTLGLNVALSFAKDALERDIVARVCEWWRSGSEDVDDARASFERIAPAALKALKRVPVLAVGRDDLGWYEADPDRASFLASVDGRRDLDAIAARTCLAPSVVVSLARMLVEEGLLILD